MIRLTLFATKTKKNPGGLIFTLLFVTIIAGGLYSFEFMSNFSDGYTSAKKDFRVVDKELKSQQKLINKLVKGSQLYDDFLQIEERWKASLNNFKEVQKEERFLGFKSKQTFFGEFGKWVAVFVYVLLMMYLTSKYLRNYIGLMLIHITLLMGCIFYLFWVFQKFQDFSKPVYYIMSFVSAGLAVTSVWLISKTRKDKISQLAEHNKELAYLAFKNLSSQDQGELISLLKSQQVQLKK